MSDTGEIRYVVFLLDRKYPANHDGVVFTNYRDAVEWVDDELKTYPNYRAIIGSFMERKGDKERYMLHVKSFGFKGDKKYTNQTKLFQ